MLGMIWVFGVLAALFVLVGVGMELVGITAPNNDRSVTLAVGGGALVFGLLAATVAVGAWRRDFWALGASIGVCVLLALALCGAGLYVRGYAGAALAAIGVIVPGLVILLHLSVAREFRGEVLPIQFANTASTPLDYFQYGRELYRQGWKFRAAQSWARAISRSPGNAGYVHSLALVLAELGHTERALAQLALAERADPSNPRYAESRALINGKK